MANLFARKPLDRLMQEAQEVGEHSLKRSLGPINLMALGIGGIIGAGLLSGRRPRSRSGRVHWWCSRLLWPASAARLPVWVKRSLRSWFQLPAASILISS